MFVADQHMSDEELEEKLEKGDFSVFTQGVGILYKLMACCQFSLTDSRLLMLKEDNLQPVFFVTSQEAAVLQHSPHCRPARYCDDLVLFA